MTPAEMHAELEKEQEAIVCVRLYLLQEKRACGLTWDTGKQVKPRTIRAPSPLFLCSLNNVALLDFYTRCRFRLHVRATSTHTHPPLFVFSLKTYRRHSLHTLSSATHALCLCICRGWKWGPVDGDDGEV
jgi:hypothetical protein